MPKLISTAKNFPWIEGQNILETYLAETLPTIELCTAAYAIVIKDKRLLHTELREGERPTKQLDIPGGHLDRDETPEHGVVRETYEETGVRVKVVKPVGYMQVTILSEKPENYRYPYPVSYMVFYLCEIVEETAFDGGEETHGRIWIPFGELEKSEWCQTNKAFIEAILSSN